MADDEGRTEEGAEGNEGIPIPGEGIGDGEAEGTGQEAKGQEINQEPNYEEIARAKGWRPVNEFDGDKDDWVGAEEFVKREPLFKRIKSQSKELKELRHSIEAMATHFKKSVEGQVQNRLNQLQAKRREAIELGDVESVEQLDGIIEKEKRAVPPDTPPDVPPEAKEWIDKNKGWFETRQDMRDFAVAHNTSMLKLYPLAEALEKTQAAVEQAFPDMFKAPQENHRKEAPPAVEGGSQQESDSSDFSIKRLSKDQKLVYDQLVKQHGTLTHEEYFKSLEDIGELE